MFVSVQLATGTVVPLSVIVLLPCVAPNPVPAIATSDPTTPEIGDKLVILRVSMTVKLMPLLETPLAFTTTFPVVAPLGTCATMVVALQLVGGASVPLKVTVLVPCAALKLVPVMVTEVPTRPEVTDRFVILGEGTTVKLTPLRAAPTRRRPRSTVERHSARALRRSEVRAGDGHRCTISSGGYGQICDTRRRNYRKVHTVARHPARRRHHHIAGGRSAGHRGRDAARSPTRNRCCARPVERYIAVPYARPKVGSRNHYRRSHRPGVRCQRRDARRTCHRERNARTGYPARRRHHHIPACSSAGYRGRDAACSPTRNRCCARPVERYIAVPYAR